MWGSNLGPLARDERSSGYLLRDVPAAYRGLIDRLVGEGFSAVIGDEDTNAFGNQVVLLVHDNIRVRLVRDRGQWFLEIDAALTDEWFSPVIWMALLDKELPDARRPSAEKEASFVVRRWPDFDVLATPCAVEKLRAWQERRAAQLGALEREQSSDAT